MELFPELFTAEPVGGKNVYLMGRKLDGSVIVLPITYSELETAMGVEGEYGEGRIRGKFVLLIAPGQSALSRT